MDSHTNFYFTDENTYVSWSKEIKIINQVFFPLDHGASHKQPNVQKVQQTGSSSAYNIHAAFPHAWAVQMLKGHLLNDFFGEIRGLVI